MRWVDARWTHSIYILGNGKLGVGVHRLMAGVTLCGGEAVYKRVLITVSIKAKVR